MTEKTEALRLAEQLEAIGLHGPVAAELRRLHTDAEESEALRERLSELLRNTAIALRGPEPELTRWSWHDLPELAAALKAQRDALLEALELAADFLEHSTEFRIGHPGFEGAQAKARAAIKAVEGGEMSKKPYLPTTEVLPMKYRRMEFNAQLQTENDRLRTQRDALLGLLKEARKIIRATSSRNLVKDWDQRTTDVIKAVEENT